MVLSTIPCKVDWSATLALQSTGGVSSRSANDEKDLWSESAVAKCHKRSDRWNHIYHHLRGHQQRPQWRYSGRTRDRWYHLCGGIPSQYYFLDALREKEERYVAPG